MTKIVLYGICKYFLIISICCVLFGQKSHHDGVLWKPFPNCFYKLHKVFRVAIGHVQADVLDERNGLQDAAQFL